MNDDLQLFRKYSDDEDFRRWVQERVVEVAYEAAG